MSKVHRRFTASLLIQILLVGLLLVLPRIQSFSPVPLLHGTRWIGELSKHDVSWTTNGVKSKLITEQTHNLKSPTTSRGAIVARLPSTKLLALLDVPDGFFTVTFFTAGILLQLSKGFGRYRMEERAWEQRLEDGRQLRRQQQQEGGGRGGATATTAMTELDYRRQEAAQEWSAYGKPRLDMEREKKRRQDEARTRDPTEVNRSRGRRRVMVEDDEGDDDDDQSERRSQYEMTDDEILAFEVEYGIDYDPYYDEPYSEEELPPGKFQVDKRYGDRIYDDGEIFYRDSKSGLYYRQGSKPRNPSLW